MGQRFDSSRTRHWIDLTMFPMVAIAQLVESRIVIPVVKGSSPFSHPIWNLSICGSGEIGRRTRFRFWRLRCKGSSPFSRTTMTILFFSKVCFFLCNCPNLSLLLLCNLKLLFWFWPYLPLFDLKYTYLQATPIHTILFVRILC